jgi:hypothetical protein
MALVGQRGSNTGGLEYGLGVYARSGNLWNFHDFAYVPRWPEQPSPPLAHAISGNLIAVAQPDGDRSGVTVYRRTSSGVQLVARLHTSLIDLPPSGLRVIYHVDISGRTVVAAAAGSAWVFTLPENLTAPNYVQDDFQDGNANGWRPFPTNAWTVASTTRSRVYRQNSLVGDARTLVTDMDWTNQSIQVDVTPRAFDGNDRWFGLIVRYTDPNNFYYVTARSSNEIRLRRLLNGQIGDLGFTLPQYNIALNRPYRLRLEAVGTRIRAYVDDAVMIEAIDDTLTHGAAGMAVYKARADYDNVLVSPNPQQTVRADDFMQFAAYNWTLNGGQWAFPPDFYPEPGEPDPYARQRVLYQTLAQGDARAIAGPPLDDQRVRARVSAASFANKGWFGLIARHVDNANYYYLKVAGNGDVAIRKLINGSIVELARTTLPISANRFYTLELQVVGNKLLAYIDGRFLLQASDSSHDEGRYGVMTYNAAARFDDFSLRQP